MPITAWQLRMIETGRDPLTTNAFLDRTYLRWAYLFRPRADERRARRAFDQLVKRHDSLRLRFVQDDNGAWCAETPERHSTGLVVEDLGEMDHDAMMAAVNRAACAPMPVLSDRLFEMRLMKFGRMGDVLLTRAHHAIVDAYGSGLIMEELFRLVMGLPLPFKPVSHAEATAFRLRQLRENEAASDAFWRARLLPLPPLPDLGRHAKGLAQIQGPQVEATRRASAVFSQDDCARLQDRAKASGATLYALAYTAFGDLLCEEGGVDRIILGTVYSGRHVAALNGYVGPVMTLGQNSYATDGARGLDDKAAAVSRMLAEAADNLPSSALFPGGPIAQAFADQGRRWLQYFVHAPKVRAPSATAGILGKLNPARDGSLSFGPVTIAKLDLAPPAATDAELQLSIVEMTDGVHIDLAADASAFTADELDMLGVKLRERLL